MTRCAELALLRRLLSVVVSIAFINILLVAGVTDTQDVNALTELYHVWNDNQIIGWDITTDPCVEYWLGVTCASSNDSQYDRVTSLILVNQGLSGTLSSAIGDLAYLQYLDVSYNPNLGGSLPSSLGKLQQMERLYMQACNISGTIPLEIGNMSKLQYLMLANNSLSGPIPDTVGYLADMFWFDVSYNLLNGSLPVSDASPNNVGLDNMTKSEHIHIQGNRFSGTIPRSLFRPYLGLLHLLLAENQFTGSIPSNINELKHLDIIRLDNNRLSGTIPTTINTITNLTTLQLNNNGLSGEIPNLSNDTKLEILMLQSNTLNGTFNLSGMNSNILNYIDVSNNNIQNLNLGDYDQTNGNPNTFLMYGNPYCSYGNYPSIVNCQGPSVEQSTTTIDVYGCDVCKGSPNERVNPNDHENCLCARPVMVTWSFYALKVKDLTKLSSGDITNLRVQFWKMWNASQFTQSIQPSLQLTQIDIIATAQNALNVSIFPPHGQASWDDKEALLVSFVLQNQDIWFSSIGPMFSIFWAGTYKSTGGSPGNSLSMGAKIGIGVAASILFIAFVLLGTYAVKQRKRALSAEERAKPFHSWISTSEGREDANIPMLKGARWFSFQEILDCTNNFNSNNEIGVGGYGKVYKGYLPSKDIVAIKRSSTTSLQGVTEFKNEIELLSRVHHRNLVGLIGFCFEEGEQILVYKYIPNGTLRECLKDPTRIEMTWDRRISLALDAAKGITYLHNEADPPIIHRDIKSNNILLDENLVAMVADFGLSKLSPKDGDEDMASANVKGTLGYLDPNYYLTGKLTNKSDVYSFGVVLLELITGRQPFSGGKYLVRELEVAYRKGGLDQVINQNLLDSTLVAYPSDGLRQFLELGMKCVDDEPDNRPSMDRVVKELENIIQLYSSQPYMSPSHKKQTKISFIMDHKSVDFDTDSSSSNNARNILYATNNLYMQQKNESSSFDNSLNFETMGKVIDPK